MKNLLIYILGLSAICSIVACTDTKTKTNTPDVDSTLIEPEITDSTIYGTCGDGTAMSTVEIITTTGDTLRFIIGENADGERDVQGGLLAGDRLAIIEGPEFEGERQARKIVNLTTLMGKWTSLDKNFEMREDGTVESTVKAENNPWTSWKILNGQLLLNRDTFEINQLSQDSLYLENRDGIFVYKRL